MKNLIKTLKKVSLLILAISFIGCDDDEAVLPQLTAGFTYTINSSTGTVTFINTSINASMYEWDFGDESTSNLINPVNVYENGTYLVVLKSSNVAGAFDIFSDEITINVTEVEETCDAETAESLSASDFNMTFMSDPTASIISDGAGFSWIDNPDFENDVNASCKVGQINRTSAAQYANNQLILDAKLDFDSNSGFKLKVWSPTASTPVLLKLEDQTNSSIFNEVSATTSADSAGAWEELTFDFESADSNKFDKVVVFFELGTSTEQTYYIDDLMLYGEGNGGTGGGGGGGTCTPETMESYNAANLNMTFQTDPSADFISDGAGFSWLDNPDFDNTVNTSCKVGQINRTSAAQYANNQYDLDAKLDFNSNSGFKLKVWSPTASTNVLLKLEDQTNAGTFKEVSATTSATSAGEWEELTFDFDSTDSNKFDKIVLFFQLATSIQETYYIDDLKLYGNGNGGGGGGGGGGAGGDCPEPPAGELLANGDFEAGDVGCWQFFNGVTISTTVNNGGSQSAQLQGSPGVAVGLKMERFGTGVVTPNTSYTVEFDILASDVLGEGGLVKAFTFSEGADGGSVAATQHILTDNTSSVSTTAWETKTFTFTTAANANQVEGGLSFLIEIVNSAAILYVDNISVRETP